MTLYTAAWRLTVSPRTTISADHTRGPLSVSFVCRLLLYSVSSSVCRWLLLSPPTATSSSTTSSFSSLDTCYISAWIDQLDQHTHYITKGWGVGGGEKGSYLASSAGNESATRPGRGCEDEA